MKSKLSSIFSLLKFLFSVFKRNKLQKVYIQVGSPLQNRRLYHICSLFQACGYFCVISIPIKRFLQLDVYGKKICLSSLSQKAIFLNTRNIDIEISDDIQKLKNANKYIRIRDNVFFNNDIYDNDLFYPQHFHPNLQNVNTEKKAALLFNDSRKPDEKRMSVFFAGNVNIENYNKNETKDYFHLNTRWEIINKIREEISINYLYEPTDYQSFVNDLDTGLLWNKIVIVDTNKVKIPQEKWLEILSKADFFLHTPGYVQPYCHNQPESMSVGCIPITQFPWIFKPELINDTNSCIFHDLAELVNIISGICDENKSALEILRMQKETEQYFKTNLSMESFKNKFDQLLNSQDEINLYICAGNQSMYKR